MRGLEKDISQLGKDHIVALKAKDDVLQQKVNSAVRAALDDASEKIISDYKSSDEFMSFVFEYLERGIKATTKWADIREREAGTLKASDFMGLSFADPQFAQALQEVEEEAAAPVETATLEVTEVGGGDPCDDAAEVTNQAEGVNVPPSDS